MPPVAIDPVSALQEAYRITYQLYNVAAVSGWSPELSLTTALTLVNDLQRALGILHQIAALRRDTIAGQSLHNCIVTLQSANARNITSMLRLAHQLLDNILFGFNARVPGDDNPSIKL